jgi:hypothetical protein
MTAGRTAPNAAPSSPRSDQPRGFAPPPAAWQLTGHDPQTTQILPDCEPAALSALSPESPDGYAPKSGQEKREPLRPRIPAAVAAS